MTMTSDSIHTAHPLARDMTPAGNLIWRLVLVCVGTALAVSAFGLWIVGGAVGGGVVLLMKLGASLFMLLLGLGMIVCGRDAP
ncbi:hypothetical protein [Sagittula sp. SSi028]|uniref:hypothetical protein n=1 Tax=Sagittula sp. SSi028 TaxID=3400636 RepID=UPI003AF53289